VAYNVPAFSLRDRFSATSKYGLSWQYMVGPKLILEAEYHRSEFDNGKLAAVPFLWSVDKKEYVSPAATSEMRFNSVALNLMIFFDAPSFKAKDFVSYFIVGGGFYDYRAENRNFIFPGQTAAPLNTSLVLQPQIDTQTALAVNTGLGLQAFVLENIALDLRARYHIVVGELRPMFDWGIDKKTVPLQLVDLSAGVKFYFWK
jgi:hypothetical protein